MKTKKCMRLGCALLLAAALVLLGACAGGKAWVSPYDWANLKAEDGRYYYYKDGALVSETGVDVSSHQGVIDWDKVAGDGIGFAFVRIGNRGATEGALYLDDRYYANISGAADAGIPVGVYFFSQAKNEQEALEEADFVLTHLKGVKLDYPVVFDQEPVLVEGARANDLSPEQLTKNAQAFCGRIESAGYPSMVYGNMQDMEKLDLQALSRYDVWFAEYNADQPHGAFDFTMWQYSNTGDVDGIGTDVDMNIHFLEA